MSDSTPGSKGKRVSTSDATERVLGFHEHTRLAPSTEADLASRHSSSRGVPRWQTIIPRQLIGQAGTVSDPLASAHVS
jgi:hypothetical protein